jgi:CRISPR-associated protein Csc3
MRLLNRLPETLEERYFKEIRPLLYERHGTHHQWGTREKHTLAEHLDSACQFVLTVSRMAGVPDKKRAVILAATAVHDLNKLDESGRNVKTLARNKDFLREQQQQLIDVGDALQHRQTLNPACGTETFSYSSLRANPPQVNRTINR